MPYYGGKTRTACPLGGPLRVIGRVGCAAGVLGTVTSTGLRTSSVARRRPAGPTCSAARQPTIGQLVDEAMAAVERNNPSLRGCFPRITPALLSTGSIWANSSTSSPTSTSGAAATTPATSWGRVYEYFLGQFASAEGKKGGEFYTLRCVVKMLVETLEPYRNRIYDPCCGSAGMFMQSEEFIRAHRGQINLPTPHRFMAWLGHRPIVPGGSSHAYP